MNASAFLGVSVPVQSLAMLAQFRPAMPRGYSSKMSRPPPPLPLAHACRRRGGRGVHDCRDRRLHLQRGPAPPRRADGDQRAQSQGLAAAAPDPERPRLAGRADARHGRSHRALSAARLAAGLRSGPARISPKRRGSSRTLAPAVRDPAQQARLAKRRGATGATSTAMFALSRTDEAAARRLVATR